MRKLMAERCGQMLQEELKRRFNALRANKLQIARLAAEQKRLKKEWQEINSFMWELRGKK